MLPRGEFSKKRKKSLRNVINPDDVIAQYGADSMRMYEMFMGPLEATKPWNTTGVEGVFRFLKRAWRTFDEIPVVDSPMSKELARLVHGTVKKVSADLENFGFNTAISAMMVLLNDLSKLKEIPREAAEKFVLLLAPFAPHLGEELWEKLGHSGTVAYVAWPEYDEELLKVNEVECLVQILGKPRARLMLPANCSAADAEKIVLADENVIAALAGKTVQKVIYVPGRLVNIVAK